MCNKDNSKCHASCLFKNIFFEFMNSYKLLTRYKYFVMNMIMYYIILHINIKICKYMFQKKG